MAIHRGHGFPNTRYDLFRIARRAGVERQRVEAVPLHVLVGNPPIRHGRLAEAGGSRVAHHSDDGDVRLLSALADELADRILPTEVIPRKSLVDDGDFGGAGAICRVKFAPGY